jgi:DnaJ-class molecular chaperone
VTGNVRSSVLVRGAVPHQGWSVEPCGHCHGQGSHSATGYLCLHCGGNGYFQVNPDYVAPTYSTPARPKCSQCGGHNITFTAQAWADVWDCNDCGDQQRQSLGD